MGAMAKRKGANGEREIAAWLRENVAALGDVDIERNLEQTRNGGHDLIGVPGIALEVKRVETLAVRKWWEQTTQQAISAGLFPVLAYRQNRRSWQFCLPASLIEPTSYDYITVSADVFASWLQTRLSEGI